jgi:aminopeptidase N
MRTSPFLFLALPLLGCSHDPASPPPKVAAAPAVTHAAATPAPPALRLPKVAAPERYDLELRIVPSNEQFDGRIGIDLVVREATPILWLNATQLEVRDATIDVGGKSRAAKVVAGGDDFVGFAFDPPLEPGKARLTIAYRGALDSVRSQGLYRQAEGDASYVYSFFEALDARRAFPCFDEPDYKVPWKLTLHVPKGDVALANTPEVSTRDEADGMKEVAFAESKPLPSYLVALIVGPFDIVVGKDGPNGKPLRIAVPRGRGKEAAYAAENTGKIVRLLEQYFQIPYPYEKLDVAVVPRYWGTMEHPGLVAMGQPLTLIDPKEMSARRAAAYANTAIHELAHYWFGDLVTTAWWDDTWLNESTASWIDAKITDVFEPAWRMPLQSFRTRESAMAADALASAKAVRQPVVTRSDIGASFDAALTYSKGRVVLEMLEHWIGPERFRAIITRYLRAHAHGSVRSADFFAALGEGAEPRAAEVMTSFIEQPGFPLVSIDLKCDASRPPMLHVTQSRYAAAGAKVPAGSTWRVPVCVRYDGGAAPVSECHVVDAASADVALRGAKGCPRWIVGNDGAFGYYRTDYAPALSAALDANKKALAPLERAALFSDRLALAEADRTSVEQPLREAMAIAKEGDPFLVTGTLRFAWEVRQATPPSELPALRRLLVQRYAPILARLGYHEARYDALTHELRPRLIGLLATGADDAATQASARRLALAWLGDRASLDPDLVDAVLEAAAVRGDRALFDRVLAEARRAKDRRERSVLLGALGAFHDPALQKDAFALVLGTELDIRDSIEILHTAASIPESRAEATELLVTHFDELAARMRDDEITWLFRIVGLACDHDEVARLRAALEARAAKYDGGPFALAQALDAATTCAARKERYAPAIKAFLAKP